MSSPVNIILGVLGAQGVLSAVDGVRSSLGGLAATALGTTSALAGLQHGLALGGEMVDLSARTTQMTRDLVVVRRALDNTGVGAANAAPFIGLLQKAIAGFNEEGGKTGDVFKRIGLDPDHLRQLGIQDQLAELSAGFARIPNGADRAATAMQLFGRSGAQMLQLLGDSTALQVAEREAGRLAERLQRDAVAFDDVGDKLSIAKVRMDEFWVVAAEKALPVLTALASALESINPAPFAAAVNSVLGIFAVSSGLTLLDKLNTSLWMFASNPAISSAGQTFAQRFAAPFTSGLLTFLQTALPWAIGGLIANAVIQGILQAKAEAIAAEVAASNAAAKDTQRQRDALRNAQSLADVEAQRKKIAAEIAELEKNQSRTVKEMIAVREAGGGITSKEITRVVGLTPDEVEKLTELRRLERFLATDRPAAIVAANLQAAADADRLEKAKAIVAELTKQADSYRDAAAASRLALSNDYEKLRLLDQEAAKATTQFLVDQAAALRAKDFTALKAAQQKHEASLLAIAENRKKVEQSIAEDQKRLAEALATAAEKAKQAELERLRAKAEAGQLAAENRQLGIQRQLADLQADFGRTDAEKWAERRARLAEAVTAAQAYLDAMKQLRGTATSDEGRQLGDAAVHNALQELVTAQNQLASVGPNPNNLFDQLRVSLAGLRQEWGTTAQQIAGGLRGVVGGAVGSISSGITGLLLRTKGWRDALANVGTTVLTSVVESFVQLGVRWLANQVLMATAGKAIAAASVAATLPIAAAQSAMWAAPATLASIATFGAADAVGVSALSGALAAGQLLAAIPGFRKGGYTGEEGGFVHDHEFVFSAPAVRNIGLDNLEALHSQALSSSAGGPPSGGAAAGSPRPMLIVPVFNPQELSRVIRQHPDHDVHIVDLVKRRRGEILES